MTNFVSILSRCTSGFSLAPPRSAKALHGGESDGERGYLQILQVLLSPPLPSNRTLNVGRWTLKVGRFRREGLLSPALSSSEEERGSDAEVTGRNARTRSRGISPASEGGEGGAGESTNNFGMHGSRRAS